MIEDISHTSDEKHSQETLNRECERSFQKNLQDAERDLFGPAVVIIEPIGSTFTFQEYTEWARSKAKESGKIIGIKANDSYIFVTPNDSRPADLIVAMAYECKSKMDIVLKALQYLTARGFYIELKEGGRSMTISCDPYEYDSRVPGGGKPVYALAEWLKAKGLSNEKMEI
jgi:hypothetical protein